MAASPSLGLLYGGAGCRPPPGTGQQKEELQKLGPEVGPGSRQTAEEGAGGGWAQHPGPETLPAPPHHSPYLGSTSFGF